MEDPQNLGALLRVADGAGVDGVVLTERRSAPLSPVAVKASAGAAEHLRIARVVNLVRALEELKRQNLWIIGLDESGSADYDQFDLTGNCVVVLGREGAGLHELVRKTCDHLLRIPMAGGVSSLNVSAAGAVVLYEAARQRRNAGRGGVGQSAGSASKPKKAERPGVMKPFVRGRRVVLASLHLAVGANCAAEREHDTASRDGAGDFFAVDGSRYRADDDAREPAGDSAGRRRCLLRPRFGWRDREAVVFTDFDLDVRLRVGAAADCGAGAGGGAQQRQGAADEYSAADFFIAGLGTDSRERARCGRFRWRR